VINAAAQLRIRGLVAPDGAMIVVLLIAAEGEPAIFLVSIQSNQPN
jgi:hypothetical protein